MRIIAGWMYGYGVLNFTKHAGNHEPCSRGVLSQTTCLLHLTRITHITGVEVHIEMWATSSSGDNTLLLGRASLSLGIKSMSISNLWVPLQVDGGSDGSDSPSVVTGEIQVSAALVLAVAFEGALLKPKSVQAGEKHRRESRSGVKAGVLVVKEVGEGRERDGTVRVRLHQVRGLVGRNPEDGVRGIIKLVYPTPTVD